MVKPGTPLTGYKIVVAPMLHVMPDALAGQLVDFVARGGVLVTDHRTAVKDTNDKCIERTLPGLLSGALGIAIDEYESLGADITYPAEGRDCLAGGWTARHWADWTRPLGAEVLAVFKPWHMNNFALATRNRHAKGWAYYVGSPVLEESFYDKLMADACAKAKVEAPITPPAGVEICTRAAGDRTLVFVINHTEENRRGSPG
jgi:beta-galactosidase